MSLAVVLLGPASVGCGRSKPAALAGEAPRRFALLVGCTRYDNLPKHSQLHGGGNDTALLRGLLMDPFGFPSDNITVLSEDAGAAGRPFAPTS